MSGYTQENRLLSLKTPLGPDALLPVSLAGTEAVSRLFAFDLELVAPVGPPLAFERILGQAVSLELRQGDGGRRFHGIVSRFAETGKDHAFTSYRARVSPKMWLLTRTRRCRVFQRMTTEAILRRVLEGIDATYALAGAYPARNYCVQYDESDFDFASRLMEEDGIWYAFSHGPDGHVLHVSDDVSSAPRLPGGRGVAFGTGAGRSSQDWQVSAWAKTQELRPVRCVLRDHSFELPGDPLEAGRGALDGIKAGTARHKLRLPGTDAMELYEYPGRYAKLHDKVASGGGDAAGGGPGILDDRDRLVRTRMEAEECASLSIEGASNCGAFAAGTRFDLRTAGDAAGTYLLTRVDHAARNGGFGSGGAGGEDGAEASYANSFACQPAELPHRPGRITPRPSIPGFQTATVVGPPGEELFCDRHGRVKVQFHWDREGRSDADSSCWLRVAQVWAGKGWGAFFWPRIGHEVVVVFEDGDPDCPMIVGSVYNAANRPPYAMPAGKQLGGIRSASVRGAARQNFNGLVFNDTKGGEHLAVHSERSLTLNSELDKSITSGRHRGERTAHSSLTSVGTLPGGGGSGGGPAGGGSGGSGSSPGTGHSGSGTSDSSGAGINKGNTVAIPGPVNEAPGLNAIWVFGENMQAALGLNHQIALGNNQQICINPAGLLGSVPGLGTPLLSGLLGGGAGNLQFTLGANVQLTIGQSFQINLGPKGINLDGGRKSHVLTYALTAGLGVAAAIYAIAYGLQVASSSFVACGNWTLAYQLVVDVLLEAIMLSETMYKTQEDAADDAWRKAHKVPDPPDDDPSPDASEAAKDLAALGTGAALGALIATTLLATEFNGREQKEDDDANSPA